MTAGIGTTIPVGAEFYDWIVLAPVPVEERTQRKGRQVFCKCKCKTIHKVRNSDLLSGASRSCWRCSQKRATSHRQTHGRTKSPEYRAWTGLKERCLNPKNKQYVNYGARGISIDATWLEPGSGFQRFLSDMGERTSAKHSIHRVDNDGNYTASNCVWATTETQARAKRNNRQITVGATTKVVTDWLALTRISHNTFMYRLRCGWPEDVAATTPSLGESICRALEEMDPQSTAFKLLQPHAAFSNIHGVRT